jgi:hypothetical protein
LDTYQFGARERAGMGASGRMDRDLYAALGVPSTSTEREIRRAFHELARRYHPDVAVGDPDAARKFIEVSEAAQTLLDPWRRAAYDRTRAPWTPVSATPRPAAPAWTAPSQAQPSPWWLLFRGHRAWRRAYRIVARALLVAGGVIMLIDIIVSPGHDRSTYDPGGNGIVLWKATGYQMGDGRGINLAGSGRPIQIVPGTSADLEVASGYLSSAGHITFLPPGTAPGYQGCLTALRPASSQAEPLTAVTPGANLCSSGSTGDIAFVHVTRNDVPGLTMNITVWHYI